MDIEEIANKDPKSITKEYCKINMELTSSQIILSYWTWYRERII